MVFSVVFIAATQLVRTVVLVQLKYNSPDISQSPAVKGNEIIVFDIEVTMLTAEPINIINSTYSPTLPAGALLFVVVPIIPEVVLNVRLDAVGLPNVGVPVKTGDPEKTNDPVPVSSVTAVIKFALLGVERKVATPIPRPETPVLIGNPVQLVKMPAVGVPNAGVVNEGEILPAIAPVPD